MSNVAEDIGGLLGKLQSPDFYEREEAVRELATYAEDEAVAGLVLAMEDPDLGIRELAANHLSKIKGATASRLLIRFLAHQDIGTRNLASEILVKIGAEAVMPLVDEIEVDDHDVRKFICDVLGLIRDPRAVPALRQRLWDDNANVVCSAAEALGEIGSEEAAPDLMAVAVKIEDARLPAIEAMGKIGSAQALGVLTGFTTSDDPILRYVSIEAIGKIGEPATVKHLATLLKHGDVGTGEAAMAAIIDISRQTGGQIDLDLPLDKYSEFLFEGIKNRNEAVTEFTLSRLSHWYGNTVIDGLLDVLDYVDEDRLRQITEILGEVGHRAAKSIVAKIGSSSKQLKLKLLDVVKLIADEEIGPDILPLAEHEDHEIRQKAAHILGISGYVGAVAALKRLAADENGHVRAAAYSALGWLCNDDDVDFIYRGLEDKYSDVREATVGALVIIGGPNVVKRFTQDLYHEDAERQRLAVTALGWIGEADVIEPLLNALNHPVASVRKSALGSLARIGNVADTAPIVVSLNDENSAVRKAAVSALMALRGADAISDIR
jgi:HEAT repeat protein